MSSNCGNIVLKSALKNGGSLVETLGVDQPVFIIAEIGQNHQGDLKTAKKLIRVAKECGANCVKFQKTCLTEKFNKTALDRPYESPNSFGTTYGDHKKYLEFTDDEFRELQTFAQDEMSILFTASAMDGVSLDFLASLGVAFIKIGSGDANNLILIEKAASKKIPLLISTGMQEFNTVQEIYATVGKYHKQFALLHCVSSYPTPVKDLNLRVLNLYQSQFPDVPIGYSGHELGIHLTISAVAMGAKIIERHLTLDKNQKGSDHKCSLDPEEFKTLVATIRDLETAFGKPEKTIRRSELPCFEKLGKTVVASCKLSQGHILRLEDLKIKVAEPKGVDGALVHSLIGEKLLKDVEEDQSITQEIVQ